MSTDRRLLRDLIHIPEAVYQGDLVYRLADAASDPGRTVAEYVVTPQLEASFIAAVKLLRSAVADGVSKAAFLDGSFGAGKSNFMGVLELLLDGNKAALGKPELAPVVVELEKGAGKFLTVPFHLIGADDLESAVFGQYVEHLSAVHPGAPPPAVFASEPILANGDELRRAMGDGSFFAALSEGAGDDDWGDLGGAWTAETYQEARRAPHDSPDRIRLVQALLTTLLPAFAAGARANRGGYVSFDDGLSAISHHAASLGYDGVILFLDELILWFLSRLGDLPWVSEEISKLSKLVEGASAKRPVPLVSIIARQRDLRQLVGENVPGAEKLSFVDQLTYQQGRFGSIRLDDSNLPLVANRRLLTPVDGEAAAQLRAAFASLSLPPKVRDTLLAGSGTDESFALTYPFSPAFMTVLVDVAGALQRTRTGLRVLLDLLVARRDVLEVGQLVPVGDLYDVIDNADHPFSEVMAAAFDQARKIYRNQLRPALLDDHHLDETESPTPAFVNDDRLVKTLLLAALVPESLPFKDLTVERLVALNHGTINSPVPGQETSIATNKLRRLSASAGELRVGSDPNNPTVHVALSDVDTAAILATADNVDNTASRRTLVRDRVLDALDLPAAQLQVTYRRLWKGLPRDVEVVFGNLRDTVDLPDATFANDGPNWKVLVDFPFDDSGHTPLEDLERLDRFRQNGASWFTIAWLPAFFTAAAQDTLGRLVRLNYILANADRFTQATASLSPQTRAAARPILEAMQGAARSQLDGALLMAYGVIRPDERTVDAGHALADHFPSLRAGLTLAPPVAATLRDALDRVLDQALGYTYPGAPDFDSEVRPADVRKVAGLCADAVVEPGGRLVVNDSADRRLLVRVANPLGLGLQSEQAFTLQSVSGRWDATFTRAIHQALAEGRPANVGVLRAAIDNPRPMGLTPALENLVIVAWAQATNHTFREHGGPVVASVDRLDNGWDVVAQPLPAANVWEGASRRLSLVFGVTLPTRQLSAFAVERAGVVLQAKSAELGPAVRELVRRVAGRGSELDIDEAASLRLRTARAAAALLDAIDAAADDLGRVEALAAAALVPSAQAIGRSITSAREVNDRIEAARWQILTSALGGPDGVQARDELVAAFADDEFVTPLGPVLASVEGRAVELLTRPRAAPPPAPAPAPPAPGVRRWEGSGVAAARAQLEELAAKIAAGSVPPGSISVTITWSEPDA
ncbi:MAG: phage resistance protein [Acidimicrobiales bacterium]